MHKEYKLLRQIEILCLFGLGAVSVLAVLKTIFFSVDIDESYAICQGYRLVKGDRLIFDMWEPHQLSAYPVAILMKLFGWVTGGMESVVVYLRICGTLIHLGLAYGLYRVIRNWVPVRMALLLAFVHINYLPKWIQTPEFELMQYWLLLLTALCLFTYFRKGKGTILLIVSGVSMVLQALNYPTMILLYPFYMLGVYRMQCEKKVKLRAAVVTTAAAGVSGLGVLVYLFRGHTLGEICLNLGYILADPSHTENSLWKRMGGFTEELLWDGLSLGVVSAGAFLLVILCHKIFRRDLPGKQRLVIQTGLLTTVCLCIAQIFGCLLQNQNQFYLQERYLYVALLGVIVYRFQKGKKLTTQVLFWFGSVPAFVSVVASALLTNMTLNVSYTRFFLGCMVTFLLLVIFYAEEEREKLFWPVGVFVMSLLVCKLVLIRVTGCLPVTMNAGFTRIQSGPLRDVSILTDFAVAYEANQALLQEHVTDSDNLFLFGCESMQYVGSGANVAAASVQGTSVFNDTFLKYFDLHQSKYPTVVAVDKLFPAVQEYHYNPYNYIVANWIEQEFPYTEKIETEYMTLYIRRN